MSNRPRAEMDLRNEELDEQAHCLDRLATLAARRHADPRTEAARAALGRGYAALRPLQRTYQAALEGAGASLRRVA